jgi:hypothetical protein
MKVRTRKESFILEEVPEEERSLNANMSTSSLLEEEDGDDELEEDEVPFTKKMRVATRKVHNMSDTLVNAKLGLGSSRKTN